MIDSQLSTETIEYLEGRPKSERSPLGQFITPRALREKLASKIEFEPGMRVLDPGVGTAEFLKTCHEIEPELDLVGWDIDPQVLKVAKKIAPFAELRKQSALDQPWLENFDVVIGNPPYFEMRKLDPDIKGRYKDVLGGRPNIFSLFFAAGLGALKPGGTLGFVVPPSMNNGAFFDKLRKFILSKGSIKFLEIYTDHSLFLDVQTAVQLIVIKKGEKSKKHIVDLGALGKTSKSRVIFSEKPNLIENEFENRSTLWHLGYEAITGSLVWNANKEKLRVAPEKGAVPLLWAHNITDSKEIVINEEREKKPQYVVMDEVLMGPAIIVNRITGSVGSGNLRCALVPAGYKFVGENHINVIRARKNIEQKVSWDDLLDLLRLPGVNSRIQKLTGNTQISCVELTNWLPLDSDVAATQDQHVIEDLKLFNI
jgi:adenine-specific DNA-methyltransferase